MRRTGINYSPTKGLTVNDSVLLIRAAGFDCVFTGFKDRRSVLNYANVFSSSGLLYESVHAPFDGINSIWLDGDAGETMLGRLIDCMDACADAGVPIMVAHLSSGKNAPCVRDVGRARWDSLVAHAVRTGVKIAFENQRKLANLAFVMELYADIPEVGFCWDCGHESCFTPGIEYMPLFGKRLIYTHIHDNFGPGEVNDGDIHYLPFDGGIDYGRVAEHIRRSGFAGTLTLEVKGPSSAKYDGAFTPYGYYEEAYARLAKIAALCAD